VGSDSQVALHHSEYGFNTDESLPTDHFYMTGKKSFKDHLKSIDLAYFAVFTGAFAEFVPLMFVSVSSDNELEIIGEGDAQSSFTAIADVAAFVAESTSSEFLDCMRLNCFCDPDIGTICSCSVREVGQPIDWNHWYSVEHQANRRPQKSQTARNQDHPPIHRRRRRRVRAHSGLCLVVEVAVCPGSWEERRGEGTSWKGERVLSWMEP
jgi:hypothetical protein